LVKTKLFQATPAIKNDYLQVKVLPDGEVRFSIDNEQNDFVAGYTLTLSEAHALAEFLLRSTRL
jgi:hypothetical protein